MTAAELDFTAHQPASGIYLTRPGIVTCGTNVNAPTPDPTNAQRITRLLNEYGLLGDDTENTTP